MIDEKNWGQNLSECASPQALARTLIALLEQVNVRLGWVLAHGAILSDASQQELQKLMDRQSSNVSDLLQSLAISGERPSTVCLLSVPASSIVPATGGFSSAAAESVYMQRAELRMQEVVAFMDALIPYLDTLVDADAVKDTKLCMLTHIKSIRHYFAA